MFLQALSASIVSHMNMPCKHCIKHMAWTQRDIPQKFDYSKSSTIVHIHKDKTNLCQIAEDLVGLGFLECVFEMLYVLLTQQIQ